MWLSFSVVLFVLRADAAVSCLDANGDAVSWFSGLKQNYTTSVYMYDQSTGSLSNVEDMSGQQSSSITNTLAQYYAAAGNQGDVGYFLYNDEHPDGSTNFTCGHTKGVFVFTATEAFWVVHSVPKFPLTGSYSYPDPQRKYGQSFLCMSMSASYVEAAARIMLLTTPWPYDSYIPTTLARRYPTLAALMGGASTTAPTAAVSTLVASVPQGITPAPNGPPTTTITALSKNGQWNNDLYEDFVSPHYNSGFAWETWQNGDDNLGAFCKGQGGCLYDARDMTGVNMPDGSSWDINHDHAKWGIQLPLPSAMFTGRANQNPYLYQNRSAGAGNASSIFCMGGINRQSGQTTRGGASFCQDSPIVYAAFAAVVSGVDSSCVPCN